MIKIINSSNETLAILQNLISPIINEDINREFTFSFTTIIDNDKSSYVNYQNKVEVENNYFNIVYTEEERTNDGLFINAQCEHVSYDLIDETETAGFTATGVFSAVATTLLSGTNFTVGTSEITASETISINESTNKRQILMQLASLYNGELKFDKYEISLFNQRGADRNVQFRYRKNLAGVKKIVDNRKKVAGNPTISYQISAAELEYEQSYIDRGYDSLEHYELGDIVTVIDEDLNLNVQLRIVKESHNTEQRMQGTVEISNFVDDLSDTITNIETISVAKDNIYNGCSIGPDDGFVATRSDLLARAIMNATDGIKIQKGDGAGNWTDAIYLDTSGNGTFTGFILASQIIGGSIVIGTGSNTFNANGTDGIWLGATAFATAPFNVSLSGSATANDLTLTGGIIQVGTSNDTFRFNSTDGLWLGNTVFANAPFSVTMSGSATANDLLLTGGIFNVGTGTNTLQFNDTDGLFLGATSITTAPFSVSMSGAMTATDGTFTGGTVRTHISGQNRIELSSGKLQGLTSSNLTTGLYFDIGTIPGTGIADIFLYHNDIPLVVFLDDGDGYTIKGTTASTSMRLGGISAPTVAYGTWNFSNISAISGLDTDSYVEGNHNHGIPDGTVLLTSTGNITFVASGGFSHSHNVKKA